MPAQYPSASPNLTTGITDSSPATPNTHAGYHDQIHLEINAIVADLIAAMNGEASMDVALETIRTNISARQLSSEKGVANGYASLDANGDVPIGQLPVGTTNQSVASGNDARITGALQANNNLSDINNFNQARTHLGLGGAAVLDVGTTTGTVAAGNDSRITGALQSSNNLSDLGNTNQARTHLGLGGAATLNVGTSAGTVAAGDDSRITGAEQTTNKGAANGYAPLGASSTVPVANLPLATSAAAGVVVLTGDLDNNASSPTVVATHLTAPLPVAQGGTGAATLTGIVKGNGTSAMTAVTAPAGTIVGTSDTQTLTNKWIQKRVSVTASAASPSINTDTTDVFGLSAQAVNVASFSTNLTGTPVNGQLLWIYIVGTAARSITWGASFEASTVLLPTTTVSTDRLDVGFVYNSTTSKWRCIASA